MSSHPSPYSGKAPEPARSINLGASNDSEADLIADHNREFLWSPNGTDDDEGEPSPEAFASHSIESSPPETPDLQAQLDEAKRTIAEMQEALAKRAEKEKELERMKLQLQAQSYQQPAAKPQNQPKADSGKAASVGLVEERLQAALAQQQAMFEARLMLMQAGITEQDVQKLIQIYPSLNTISDPRQAAQFIVQAHALEKGSEAPAPKEESKPQSAPKSGEPVKTVASGAPKPASRPAEPSNPTLTEAQRWRKIYDEADQIKDKYERQKVKKRAYLALTAIEKRTKDPSLFNAETPFIQRS